MVKNEYLVETTLTAIADIEPEKVEVVPVETPPDPPAPPDSAIVFFAVDSDGFINGYGSSPPGENCVRMELSRDHPIFVDDYLSWRVEGGKLVKDKGRQEQLLASEAMKPPGADEQLKAENRALSDRVDFLEGVLTEMIFTIYQ